MKDLTNTLPIRSLAKNKLENKIAFFLNRSALPDSSCDGAIAFSALTVRMKSSRARVFGSDVDLYKLSIKDGSGFLNSSLTRSSPFPHRYAKTASSLSIAGSGFELRAFSAKDLVTASPSTRLLQKFSKPLKSDGSLAGNLSNFRVKRAFANTE